MRSASDAHASSRPSGQTQDLSLPRWIASGECCCCTASVKYNQLLANKLVFTGSSIGDSHSLAR